jgi:hypothetical protein
MNQVGDEAEPCSECGYNIKPHGVHVSWCSQKQKQDKEILSGSVEGTLVGDEAGATCEFGAERHDVRECSIHGGAISEDAYTTHYRDASGEYFVDYDAARYGTPHCSAYQVVHPTEYYADLICETCGHRRTSHDPEGCRVIMRGDHRTGLRAYDCGCTSIQPPRYGGNI